MNKILCPITGDELIYVGHEEGCMDGPSYYSPINDNLIIYSVWPRRMNIYSLVDSKSTYAKESRYFRLNDDHSWTEMKQVPHGDKLFPKRYYGREWKEACAEAKLRWQRKLEREEYLKNHPEEDARIFANPIYQDEVKVSPLGPPSGMIYYVNFKYK